MHVHVGRKKRHAVQPSVRCCLPANGTSPKYSSTLSVDMLLSDRDTLDNEPLDASNDPAVGNCRRSSSVSVSMSRDLRLYTYWWQISAIWETGAILRLKLPTVLRKYCEKWYNRSDFRALNICHRSYRIDHVVEFMIVCFTICPRPLLLCAYHRYREIVNIRILYTDIYSRYKNSLPPLPPSRELRRTALAKRTKNEANPIAMKIYWNETSVRAGTREICHVNRRENKYAWST